jgi:tetratricopeptide (TPR) repeat protein
MAGGPDAQHPGDDELERWVRGQHGEPEAAALIGHVLVCAPCHRRWAGLVRAVLNPSAPPAASYDLPVARALARSAWIRRQPQDVQRLTGSPRVRWVACEMALEEAAGLRGKGRLQEAESLALLADLAAGTLARVFGRARVADLRCRLWLEIVNLRRARNFLDGAENALAEAEDCFAGSSRDPLLAARLFDTTASLCRDQGRFDEAETALNRAYHLYIREGRLQDAGKVLVILSIVKIDTHEPWRALDLLVQATPLLAGAEPRLLLIAAHNIFMALADVGEVETVARLLWTWRRVYEQIGTPLDCIRRLYLEAKVAFGQGQPVRGEELFRRNIAGFQKAGLPFDAAVAALELAGKLLERNKTAAVLDLLNGAVAAFVEGHIYRELAVSLSLLRTAVEAGQATAELIASFTENLRQAEAAAGGRR